MCPRGQPLAVYTVHVTMFPRDCACVYNPVQVFVRLSGRIVILEIPEIVYPFSN